MPVITGPMHAGVLGIDPGISGGYAYIGRNGAFARPFPVAGKEVDLGALFDEWLIISPGLAVLELVGAMPKQGVTSSFTFGRRVGELRGLLAGLKIPWREVRPQAWKKVVLAGTSRDKASAIEWCRMAYPGVSLVPEGHRTPKDGLADALCLAEYGIETFGGAA